MGDEAVNVMTLNTSDEAAIEDRRSKAWDLRVKGKSYRAIAEALEVSVRTAFNDIAAVLERTRAENNETAESHKALSLSRLDRALLVVEGALDAQVFDADGNADNELKLKALDRMLKIEERRAKLLGLDAPTKVDAQVTTVGLDEIDELRKAAEANECSPKDLPSSSEPGE